MNTSTTRMHQQLKAITLRNIPRDLEKIISEKAETEHLSLNKAVLRLLEEATGLGADRHRLHHELDELAGTWSAAEAEVFSATIADHRVIDPEVWK